MVFRFDSHQVEDTSKQTEKYAMEETTSSQLAIFPYCYPRSRQILRVAYYTPSHEVIKYGNLRYFGVLTRNVKEYFVFIVFIGNNS